MFPSFLNLLNASETIQHAHRHFCLRRQYCPRADGWKMIQPIPAGHGGPSYFTEKRLPPLFFDTLLVHKLAAAQANQTVGALPTDVAQCIGQCAQALRHADHEASSPSIWQPGCGLDFNRWANQRIARSEEHTSELQSLMRIPYAVFC